MRLEYHEPLRLRIGQWFDYESVDIAEDRRICPDAEGEGERGDDGESRRLRQHPKPVANILQQRFDEGHAARIAMFLFELFHSAEFQTREALCFLRRQAGVDELRNLLREVKAQFVVEFGLHLFPAEEGTQSQQHVVQHGPLLRGFQDLRNSGGKRWRPNSTTNCAFTSRNRLRSSST